MSIEKLSGSLRSFAQRRDGSERTILIELDLPEPRVMFTKQGRGKRPLEVVLPEGGVGTSDEVWEHAVARVRALTRHDPRPLRASHVIVARVTPAQLVALTEEPLLKAFYEDEKLSAL